MQKFGVGAEFVYFKEGGHSCLLLELGVVCSTFLK